MQNIIDRPRKTGKCAVQKGQWVDGDVPQSSLQSSTESNVGQGLGNTFSDETPESLASFARSQSALVNTSFAFNDMKNGFYSSSTPQHGTYISRFLNFFYSNFVFR